MSIERSSILASSKIIASTHRTCHKARVFRDALGIVRADAFWLRQALLSGIRDHEAVKISADRYGTRWRADLSVARHDRLAVVTTIWIIRTGEKMPRFVTCWVL